MIADLHCHYPMHLLPADRHPHGHVAGWWNGLRDALQAEALEVLADVLNAPAWGGGWRVDLAGLERGGVGVVCSVLYWPYAEFDLDRSYGSDPEPGYFADLQHQLRSVEADLEALDPELARHTIVRTEADLDAAGDGVAFVHCVEGGFHLGPDAEAVDAHVAWLAEHGVLYITLAHLFFRGVAANAPAIPLLSDHLYELVFPQKDRVGLTELGRAAVRAMYRHGVLVDISHMRQDAIDDTFALLDELDREHGADPRAFPVIASHVGHRDAGSGGQTYNLTDDTLRSIHARGGVAGVIFAQHQLGKTATPQDSRRILRDHLTRIGPELAAIGSDLDGFIKPTLAGIDHAADLARVSEWVTEDFPEAAPAILSGNAVRVVRAALRRREA